MKLTPESIINIRNGWRVGVAVLWTLLMFTTVSNASYGDTDVEWSFFALCVIVEAVATYAALHISYQYAVDHHFDVYSLQHGLQLANDDIRAAKLMRAYIGAFAFLWSVICFAICVFIWLLG